MKTKFNSAIEAGYLKMVALVLGTAVFVSVIIINAIIH